ncbi:hypothetical protein EDB83DRAFT_2513860 [Lactarius deliciosus]|nr:hypothetical protein EDB83DRAFT_2513860 [Lactarius deliciosus]
MSPTFQYDLPMRVSHSTSPAPKRHFSHRRQPRVADVSRILDPSYLSSSASSSPTSVYADTNGILHDPDYRHFPTVAAPRRPAWESGGNDNERRRARYSAYEKSLPYARRSLEEAIGERRHQNPIRYKRRTRSHSPHYEITQMEVDEPDVVSRALKHEQYVPMHQEVPDWTPTCGQQFRRQWQAFALGVRFSIFRAQRRIRRKFA